MPTPYQKTKGESYRFRLSISECHVLSVRFLSVWHEMAPVIGCRRRPILGSGRTSYKFREMDGSRGFRLEHSSIFQARRRERRWKWTVHFSARWRCALWPTNHPLLTLNYTRPRITRTTLTIYYFPLQVLNFQPHQNQKQYTAKKIFLK